MAQPLPYNVTSIEKPSASVVSVTPEIARRWLERNEVNRNPRLPKVSQYARDMTAGRWKITGEAIKFSRDGKLLDGQHRLHAVIESGCTVQMFVVRGLPPDAQGVMDSGAGRTAADNLAMNRTKNAVPIAAGARILINRELGSETWRTHSLSFAEVYQWVDEHPDIEIAAGISVRHARSAMITPAAVTVASWIIGQRAGYGDVDKFFEAAATKIGLRKGDPVIALTKAFAGARAAQRNVDMRAQVSAIIRAYNAWITGKTLHQIRFSLDGRPMTTIPPVAVRR